MKDVMSENTAKIDDGLVMTNCFPSDLWERLVERGRRDNTGGGRDSTGDAPQTVTMRNGDQITIGGPGRFSIVDKNGNPVEKQGKGRQIAADLPVVYQLSNGAEYRTRGGWNHDEFITYPNGDYVHFTDGGKLASTKINGKEKHYA